MSKAEEATNDFCTRCFKCNKCTKVQSECTMADSYQEGYEDGYHQAEKDLELTWQDLATIEKLEDDFFKQKHKPMSDEEFYKEVLKRLKERKEK